MLVYYLAIGAAVAAAPLADETTFAALLSGQGTSDATELLGFYVLLEIYLRALGMMLIGMGLYRSGWLLSAAHTSSARYAQVVIGAGALVSATGVIWGYHQGHTPQALMLSNIPNTLVTPPHELGVPCADHVLGCRQHRLVAGARPLTRADGADQLSKPDADLLDAGTDDPVRLA